MISEQRNYKVINTDQAKEITISYLETLLIDMDEITFGLPEVHDRYHIWNVPVLFHETVIGTVSIDAYTGEIDKKHSSKEGVILARFDKAKKGIIEQKKKNNKQKKYIVSELGNMVLKGYAERVLKQLPEESIDMIFTSPPYYNARKEYSEYDTYEDYLNMIRNVVKECKRVLIDGKFFIINSSHVLVPRASRKESSSRIAVPFDIHQIFMEEGFEFVDDIIWQKPEGAGWASGRGRRFSADRNPMQYKAVPVTEYVMVYRKKPTCLIDYFIRNHPDQEAIRKSKIADGYEKTNVWYISPARDKRHPAIFPEELAEKVIMYYSFVNDVILDPFGGIGTTAKAAFKLDRRFVSIDCDDGYIESTLSDLNSMNSLIKPLEIDYRDYSNLEELPTELSAKQYIKKLMDSGIEETEIINVLKESFEREETDG